VYRYTKRFPGVELEAQQVGKIEDFFYNNNPNLAYKQTAAAAYSGPRPMLSYNLPGKQRGWGNI